VPEERYRKDVTDKKKPLTFFEGTERKNKAENSLHRHGFADNLCRNTFTPRPRHYLGRIPGDFIRHKKAPATGYRTVFI
jgi:hypothetical protein